MKTQYIVRLDMSKLPNDENTTHALMIAESLIHICGLIQIWDEPIHGHRLFSVRKIPDDVPQANVYWIQENVPIYTNNGLE